MITYRPVPFQVPITYPSLYEIASLTEIYRLNYMDKLNPDKGYWIYSYSESLEVTVIGGINRYFLIYSYPPGGFEYSEPQEIESLETWRGWIMHLDNYAPTYSLDCATYTIGIIAFLARKTELGY